MSCGTRCVIYCNLVAYNKGDKAIVLEGETTKIKFIIDKIKYLSYCVSIKPADSNDWKAVFRDVSTLNEDITKIFEQNADYLVDVVYRSNYTM